MVKIPPIGSANTVNKVVSKATKLSPKSGLPKELPLTDSREAQLINMLHPGTPFYNSKLNIQTSLENEYKNINKK